jgi:hypothetical protein
MSRSGFPIPSRMPCSLLAISSPPSEPSARRRRREKSDGGIRNWESTAARWRPRNLRERKSSSAGRREPAFSWQRPTCRQPNTLRRRSTRPTHRQVLRRLARPARRVALGCGSDRTRARLGPGGLWLSSKSLVDPDRVAGRTSRQQSAAVAAG